LPSRFSPALTALAPIRGSPPGVTRRYRFRPGLVEITPRSSARLMALSVPVPSIISLSWASSRARVAASRSAASGLWQMTNRSSSAILTSLTRRFPVISW
jgi:hypothetical protein